MTAMMLAASAASGAGGGVILGAVLVYDYAFQAVATAAYRLESDGDVRKLVDAIYTTLDPASHYCGGTGYECKATITSGTLSSGDATGSWLALSSDREWKVVKAGAGIKTCVFDIEVRLVGGSTIASAEIQLQCEADIA